MELKWATQALSDLTRLYEFLAPVNKPAAARAALGYVPVHICGKRIVEQRVAHGIHPQEHGKVSAHWRRGHWRNQAHGPGKSLRKLIWVMPVIVGTKGHDDPETGHLYLVS